MPFPCTRAIRRGIVIREPGISFNSSAVDITYMVRFVKTKNITVKIRKAYAEPDVIHITGVTILNHVIKHPVNNFTAFQAVDRSDDIALFYPRVIAVEIA